MALPDMTKSVLREGVPAREVRMTYYDGSSRTVYCTDEEEAFPEGGLIVSRTDLNGIITHANEAFVVMSGHPREALIGAPQNILRHPDMPRAAYKSLWDSAQRGEKWHGYVKNLRMDGSFYWVYATVVPNVRGNVVTGYTSVRRKASRTRVAEAAALYEKQLNQEASTS